MPKPVAYLWTHAAVDRVRLAAHAEDPARTPAVRALAESVARKVIAAALDRWVVTAEGRGLTVTPGPAVTVQGATLASRLLDLRADVRAAVREALQSAGYTVRKG